MASHETPDDNAAPCAAANARPLPAPLATVELLGVMATAGTGSDGPGGWPGKGACRTRHAKFEGRVGEGRCDSACAHSHF